MNYFQQGGIVLFFGVFVVGLFSTRGSVGVGWGGGLSGCSSIGQLKYFWCEGEGGILKFSENRISGVGGA